MSRSVVLSLSPDIGRHAGRAADAGPDLHGHAFDHPTFIDGGKVWRRGQALVDQQAQQRELPARARAAWHQAWPSRRSIWLAEQSVARGALCGTASRSMPAAFCNATVANAWNELLPVVPTVNPLGLAGQGDERIDARHTQVVARHQGHRRQAHQRWA
jgi:hypothetical protein